MSLILRFQKMYTIGNEITAIRNYLGISKYDICLTIGYHAYNVERTKSLTYKTLKKYSDYFLLSPSYIIQRYEIIHGVYFSDQINLISDAFNSYEKRIKSFKELTHHLIRVKYNWTPISSISEIKDKKSNIMMICRSENFDLKPTELLLLELGINLSTLLFLYELVNNISYPDDLINEEKLKIEELKILEINND